MLSDQALNDLVTKARELLIIGCNDCHGISEEIKICCADGLGGVILFDLRAIPFIERGEAVSKNITSPKQVTKLNQALKTQNPSGFIAVDHEGGMDRIYDDHGKVIHREGVTRLHPMSGFPKTLSAAQIGKRYLVAFHQAEKDNSEDPRHTARTAIREAVTANANLIKQLGFNLVFAPVVDIHDPQSPIIGKINRAYSSNIDCVIDCAQMQIAAYGEQGIACAMKHYPGHGHAEQDSHFGLVDVSKAWHLEELKPYQVLADDCDMVMLGHLLLSSVDPQYPASISAKHIKNLREFFSGVIASDDYEMAGLTKFLRQHYQDQLKALNPSSCEEFIFEKTLEHAFNAGVDLLIFGNQLKPFQPTLFLEQYSNTVKKLLATGRIQGQKIHESHQRVVSLKQDLR